MAKQFETQQDSSLCKTHRHLCFVAATLYLHPAVYTVLRDEYHIHHIPHRRHSHKRGQVQSPTQDQALSSIGRYNYIRYLETSVFWHYLVEAVSRYEPVSYSDQAQPGASYGNNE